MVRRRAVEMKKVSGESRETDEAICTIKTESRGEWRVGEVDCGEGNNREAEAEADTGEAGLNDTTLALLWPAKRPDRVL